MQDERGTPPHTKFVTSLDERRQNSIDSIQIHYLNETVTQ